MKQTTNAILMIRPVAFRMNEQTAVNNYYQKVLDGLSPETVNAKAQEEFDTFVNKLRMVGVDVTVVEDTVKSRYSGFYFPEQLDFLSRKWRCSSISNVCRKPPPRTS